MRTALYNVIGLLVALAIAVWIVPWGAASTPTAPVDLDKPGTVVDATGRAFPPRDYRRIASASTVSDELLLELCAPDRIVAFTRYSQTQAADRHRYQGKPGIETITDVESILRLDPDLVLVHSIIDPRHVERLREAGIVVFDLGPVEGIESLAEDIDLLSTLVGHPARGERLARKLRTDLESVASDIPEEERQSGLFLAVFGSQIFGGTEGSSYHDLLQYAGLNDAAATKYRGSPSYSVEQLLALDPRWIVTSKGSGAQLCGISMLGTLEACQDGRRGLVEIEDALLGSGALGTVEAAREVRAQVYGPRR